MFRNVFFSLFVVYCTCLFASCQTDPPQESKDDSQLQGKEIFGNLDNSLHEKCRLLKNEFLSDVRIVLVKSNSDGTEQVVDSVPAHKTVLAFYSPVFKEMLLTSEDTVKIENITSETLDEMLRFIYCDRIHYNDEMLFNLVEAALKYQIKELFNKSLQKLKKNMRIETAILIYKKYQFFGMREVKLIVSEFLQVCDKKILTPKLIETFDRPMMKLLLEQPILKIDEEDLFDLLLIWARKQAEMLSIYRPSREELREIMGDLLYLIRFHQLSFERNKYVFETILYDNEIGSLRHYQRYGSPITPAISKFNLNRRSHYYN